MALPILEMAKIELAEGRSEADLLAASDKLQEQFLKQQPGFLRRELLRGEAGEFYDLVLWASQADADAIMQKAAVSQDALDYFAVMKMGEGAISAGVRHLKVLARYG